MFIDEWFGDFYKKLPLGCHNPANFRFGQVFWTYAYYLHDNWNSSARRRTLTHGCESWNT